MTLNVGLSEAGDVIGTNFKNLTQEFEKQHPNVKVDVQAKDFASSLSTIKLVMSGDNPPDLMQGNSGWSIDGALWKAHLIANLDPYAQHYGWFDKFPDSALVVNRFSADGKTLGEGNLVGLPQAIQYVGVFYNKRLLDQLGVTDPTTLDKAGLIASLDKAKAAGMTPVMLGDSDKWPALHNLSLFNGWYVPAAQINQWVFNRTGSNYDDAGHLKGSTDFQDWMANGYFNKDALATSFSDATARFGKGEAPYFITGTWALGDVEKALGNDAGFMLFPAGASGTHEAVGGYSLPWTMSTKSKNPACAGQLLDFITTSSAAVDAQIASGRPSATKAGADAQISDPLLTQMVQQYKKLSDDKGLFTWEDWPTPTMLQYMGSQAQLLLGGQLTPKAYNESIQKNWSDYMATR
ncbi:ABC transporter substrate-binding protein [Microbacterium sp. ASV49]|uniref:Extracellular solute-binding protein n=1 Tax=Microbacterium candidum TaxID=3041922 RepID=A0ABT7N211_9MICO|nr:extracellular solute-binding protein [Microbacterium sp. ASV49]MDL9980750.1 extracellular solute-binding protein [Microbacterium sp. ASV49]